MLLIFENLQWLDASSLELLHYIVRQPGAGRVAIVLTVTDDGTALSEEMARFTRSVVRLPALKELRLAPLEGADLETMVRRAFRARSRAVTPFCERLHAQSGGNPFFTEEILKSLVEQGALRQVGDRWVGWDSDLAKLTAAGRALVRARLATLSDDGRRLANDSPVARSVTRAIASSVASSQSFPYSFRTHRASPNGT